MTLSSQSPNPAGRPDGVPGDVRQALRDATAHLHARVDSAMPLARPAPSLADYRAHLVLMREWAGRLRALPVSAARLDALDRSLARDIRDCDAPVPGTPADEHAVAPDTAESDPAGWGVAYVIEGSRLGGQMMYRQLAERLAPHPLAFLRGAGRDTGARWTAFLAALRAAVATPQQVDAACGGAVRAFELLAEACDPRGAARSPSAEPSR